MKNKMFDFTDKYHFKNYIRKVCFGIGLPIDDFEEYYAEIFYSIYDFENEFSGFLYFHRFELCKQVRFEIRKLNKGDLYYLAHILKDYEQLKKELAEVSSIIRSHPNYEKHKRNSYGINIKKYRILCRSASEQNKFITLYKGRSELSEIFIKFIEDNEMKTGLYFLYDTEKKLNYIGKSINLGSRILSSVKERGAFYISVAYTESKSDMHIYEPYYILKENPILNAEFQETDSLNIKLKELKISKMLRIYKEEKH
jgi:hypothetical protein